MPDIAYIRARIDASLKAEATLVLDSLGLTISDVMRMVITRIARDKALPIELTRPNSKTIEAIEEARAIMASYKSQVESALN